MAFRRPSPDPMAFAKIAGRQKIYEEAKQNLINQRAALEKDMGGFSIKSMLTDIGSSFLGNKLVDFLLPKALGLLTGGIGTAASLVLPSMFPKGAIPMMKTVTPEKTPNIFSKLLKIGGKSVAKAATTKELSNQLAALMKIKPPEAPSLDMSKYLGAGMSGTRESIGDMLETSKSAYDIDMQGFRSNRDILNFLMSFSADLKEPLGKFKAFGKEYTDPGSIEDILRDLIGLDKKE